MQTKEVELEIVSYRTKEIAWASAELIHNFARYSGIFGTEQWLIFMDSLLNDIRLQNPRRHEMSADGVELGFSGFRRPVPIIEDGERIVYRAREPYFVIWDRAEEILPRRRSHAISTALAIAEEMNRVYRLEIEKDPTRLIFSHKEYARSVEIFNAALITDREYAEGTSLNTRPLEDRG